MEDFLFGLVLGIFLHRAYLEIKFYLWEKRVEEKTREALGKFREKVIPSRIEVVNGMYFIYNRETNEFLGQANNMVELEKLMRTKYPNKLFDVPNEQLMEVMKEKTNV